MFIFALTALFGSAHAYLQQGIFFDNKNLYETDSAPHPILALPEGLSKADAIKSCAAFASRLSHTRYVVKQYDFNNQFRTQFRCELKGADDSQQIGSLDSKMGICVNRNSQTPCALATDFPLLASHEVFWTAHVSLPLPVNTAEQCAASVVAHNSAVWAAAQPGLTFDNHPHLIRAYSWIGNPLVPQCRAFFNHPNFVANVSVAAGFVSTPVNGRLRSKGPTCADLVNSPEFASICHEFLFEVPRNADALDISKAPPLLPATLAFQSPRLAETPPFFQSISQTPYLILNPTYFRPGLRGRDMTLRTYYLLNVSHGDAIQRCGSYAVLHGLKTFNLVLRTLRWECIAHPDEIKTTFGLLTPDPAALHSYVYGSFETQPPHTMDSGAAALLTGLAE